MGFRLSGKALKTQTDTQLVSSGVSFGTVQLLPDGQLVVLMADHQTTGGYPKIAQVITAHLPLLAQMKPSDGINFQLTDLAAAEQKLVAQQKYLQHLQNACKLKLQNLL
jgi:antagonist of KipI